MRFGKRVVWLFIFALSLLLLYTCERHGPVEQEGPAEATFSSIQTSIFDQSCALSGCHRGSDAPVGLDLSEGKSYENLVNVPSREKPSVLRIEPNNADSSYLVLKLEGAPVIKGEQMPFGREPLPDGQIDLIRQWIDDGAQKN